MSYAAWVLLAAGVAATPAAPHRDAKSWGMLIAEAKKHGGTETKLDKSTSYVFQQQDGGFLTLTEWRTPLKRFVCGIASNQKSTVCVRWETGQTIYGERADDASTWKNYVDKPPEPTKEKSPIKGILEGVGEFVSAALGCGVDFIDAGQGSGRSMFGGGQGQMVLYAGGVRRP